MALDHRAATWREAANLEVYRAGAETGVTRPESVSPGSYLFLSKGLDLQMHLDAGV
jgi:hypothetical protein